MLNSFIEWKQAHFFLHNSYLPEFFVSFFCLYKHCGLYFINIPSIFYFSLYITNFDVVLGFYNPEIASHHIQIK